jgi:error-prone DNA polymerase
VPWRFGRGVPRRVSRLDGAFAPDRSKAAPSTPIDRRTGQAPITYLHPKLQPVLEHTLGVPLFREQLMRMAMVVGGIDGDEANVLRRAMGSKRGVEKISPLRTKLFTGMEANGITGDLAEERVRRVEP